MAYRKRKLEAEQEPNNALVVELDQKKQVSVRQYNGVSLVDIREFYLDKDTGEKKPGKKGIALTEELYMKLVEAHEEIKKALEELKQGGARAQKTEQTKKIAVDKVDGDAAGPKSKKVKSAETVEESESENE